MSAPAILRRRVVSIVTRSFLTSPLVGRLPTMVMGLATWLLRPATMGKAQEVLH